MTYALRKSLTIRTLALGLMLCVASAALAEEGRPRVNKGPFKVFMVVWRGVTDAEKGFMDYLSEKKIDATFVIKDCKNDKKALPPILAEIRKTRPDLIYSFGTTATLFIAGKDGENDSEKYITDIPVIFNIVAKPVGSKIAAPPSIDKSIKAEAFEKKVLARVENKEDRAFILASFAKDKKGASYGLRGGLSKGQKNRIRNILLRTEYLSLLSNRNLTGCSHLVPMDAQMKAIKSTVDVKKIGVIFNPAEDNALQQVEELDELCRQNGIDLVRSPLPLDESRKPLKEGIPGAVELMASKGIDLAYIPSDSFVIANTKKVMEEFNRRGIKTFSATEDPILKGGALMGLVSHYYNVGQFAGFKAAQILAGGKDPGTIRIETLKRYSFLVNMDTARMLKFYPPVSILKFAEIVRTSEAKQKP